MQTRKVRTGVTLMSLAGIAGTIALCPEVTLAQIVPDETLGEERSTVTRETIRGINSDRIDGGARRGQNLFHSFQQFDVLQGEGAYFSNPDGVANIFSRVTGADRSEIMGRLGVLGNANLFFMNPNGILFGVNSSLDVTGSFVVTTANGIQFGEQGFFSATNPELPSPLLTIDPSVFLFNQIPTGTITNNSITPVSATSPAGFNVFGLHVPDGESLLLLGGDINITGGRLNAFGGRIELAGLAGIGAVGITTTDQGFAFSFAPDSVFADLSLNDARIAVRGGGRGDIVIHADEFTATNGGRLLGGIETTGNSGNILVNANRVNFSGVGLGGIGSGIFQEILANASGNTGDIVLNTRSLTVASGGLINTLIRAGGTGNAGDIRVAADTIEVVGLDATRRFESGIRSETTRGSTGNGGNVTISSRVLEVRDGANIVAITRNSGQGGNLQVTATERAELVGIAVNAQGQAISASGLFAATVRIGNAGRLQFEGRQLRIRDGAVISAATFGTGDAGDIRITADAIELVGLNATGQFASGIGGETNRGSTGNGGDVIISSRVLQVRDGATVSVSTRGTGQGGNLEVTATERAELVGTAVNAQGLVSVGGLFATTAGAGNAGSLQFEGGQLRIRDGASISAATSGAGDAGDIRVAADAIELVGSDISRQFPSGIGGETHRGSTGSGGDVTVSSRVLEIRDGAISVATFGAGQGGSLQVIATERAELMGTAVNAQGQAIGGSGLFAITSGTGNAGSLQFEGGQLRIRDGAVISAATFGAGNAGEVRVTADLIELVGLDATRQFASGIGSETNRGSTGSGGDVSVSSRVLQVRDGATVSVSTRGTGQGGNLQVTTIERAELVGTATDAQGLVSGASGLFATTSSTGSAGSLRFEGGQLQIRDGASISAATSGAGDAGDIRITADSIELTGIDARGQTASSIDSSVERAATGSGGDVTVSSRILEVQDGAKVSVSTRGVGQGGNLVVTVTERAELVGTVVNAQGLVSGASGLFAATAGVGNAGSLRFEGGQLRIRDGASISAATSGAGDAGDIRITADAIELVGSDISRQFPSAIGSETHRGSTGSGGDVTVSSRVLEIRDGAISVATFGSGQGGNLQVIATERAELGRIADNAQGLVSGASGLFAATAGAGNAGSLQFEGGQLRVRDGAVISAATFGAGDAGDIRVTADSIELTGIDASGQFPSGIVSEVSRGARGSGGNIDIEARSLTLTNNAEISASTSGQGNAGNIRIRNTDRISLNNSTIATDVSLTGIGTGGRIAINTERLNLNNRSRISARTQGQGRAGDIDVFAVIVSLSNGSRLQTNTSSNQNAGNITLRVNDRIAIEGRRSGIFASTTGNARGNGGFIQLNSHDIHLNQRGQISAQSRGRGQAGRIQIQATGDLELEERSAISTQSQRNQAGDIAIQADRIEATHSDITTSAVRSSGGNIRLVASQIRLNGDSDLRTNSRTEGGNITLSADSILAFEDSDIFAFAGVRGGDIQLDTLAFFGNQYQSSSTSNSPEGLDGNDRTDINASGQVSSGEIATPDTSLIQNSLSDLPESAIDTQALISSSCVVRREEQSGSFTVTGTEGLPERPGEFPRPRFPTGEVRSVPDAASDSGAGWQVGDPIVEPQGVYQLPDGQLVLSRECN